VGTSLAAPYEASSSLSFDPRHYAPKADEEGSLVDLDAEAEDVEGQAKVHAKRTIVD
jgi:hypothetical protein